MVVILRNNKFITIFFHKEWSPIEAKVKFLKIFYCRVVAVICSKKVVAVICSKKKKVVAVKWSKQFIGDGEREERIAHVWYMVKKDLCKFLRMWNKRENKSIYSIHLTFPKVWKILLCVCCLFPLVWAFCFLFHLSDLPTCASLLSVHFFQYYSPFYVLLDSNTDTWIIILHIFII